jgi:hypothetical protein
VKAFIYNGRTFIRCVPVKKLFQSNLIHSVVSRGDVFAVDVETQELTIVPGTATVDHIEYTLPPTQIAAKLAGIKAELAKSMGQTCALLKKADML